MDLENKIDIVKNILKGKKVAIGFSGGADSTLIAYLSSKVAKDTIAITINNHLMPSDFIENTKKTSESFGIRHEIVDINFYEDEDFLKNSAKRCFTCRDLMYSTIKKVARENDFDFICDGNNISDLVQDRPGILITYKNGFETPFIEARLTSKDIHEYLDKNNIGYSRSTTCLATRIPTNTQVDRDKIEKINESEKILSDISGCELVKVRDFNEVSVCEVNDFSKIINENSFNEINDKLKSIGYKKICLNLSPLDDDEDINLDYENGQFQYQLPFTINLENTKSKLIKKIVFENSEKIELEKISINKNGLIEGHNFKNYDEALFEFMDTLPQMRRNV